MSLTDSIIFTFGELALILPIVRELSNPNLILYVDSLTYRCLYIFLGDYDSSSPNQSKNGQSFGPKNFKKYVVITVCLKCCHTVITAVSVSKF